MDDLDNHHFPSSEAIRPVPPRKITPIHAVDPGSVGPGAPAESIDEAISALRRDGVLVDIGGMMEHPPLDPFSMMCSQKSLIDSLLFSTGEAQDMVADMAGGGVLDLPWLEHHTFPLAEVNEALDDLPARHGGFSNYLCIPWPGSWAAPHQAMEEGTTRCCSFLASTC